jgi:hypothetical protein
MFKGDPTSNLDPNDTDLCYLRFTLFGPRFTIFSTTGLRAHASPVCLGQPMVPPKKGPTEEQTGRT